MMEKIKPGEPGDGQNILIVYYNLYLHDIMSQMINVCW